MTNEQIKNYLEKYRIDSEESLAKHIEELKRNTIPNNEIIFPLVDMLVNEKSVLNSFFAENKKIKNPMTYLDEALENIVKKEQQIIKDWNSNSTGEGEFLVFTTLEKELASDKDLHLSTRHKSKVGETHKEGLEEVMNLINSNKFKQDYNRAKECINEFCKNEGIPFEYDKEDKNFFSKCIKTNGSIVKEDEDSITIDFSKVGKKETEGKLFYELDFNFIKQMAERMQSNKDNDKYELWNWKKPMTPKGLESLKQAMWRHIIAVMQGEFEDDGREFGHLEAISNNAMIINYQLKNQ